ncbi:hypothetical protein HOK021_19190 [Streptomyces hygroscopicus]|nr:hypothetical protein HOK021_19190 [Streptomyces hygroscopicus]
MPTVKAGTAAKADARRSAGPVENRTTGPVANRITGPVKKETAHRSASRAELVAEWAGMCRVEVERKARGGAVGTHPEEVPE